MQTLEQLLAIEEIRSLKHRYFHALDAKDWEAFAAIFTEDASADMREAGEPGAPGMVYLEGWPAMLDYVQNAVGHLKTIHHGFSPSITLNGPETATGVWQMEDRLYAPDGDGWRLILHGFGHYHERYVKRGGVWLYHHVKLTRHHLEPC